MLLHMGTASQRRAVRDGRMPKPPRTRMSAEKNILTWRQIEARYDGEWVLIRNPVVDQFLRVRSGEVVCHSQDRDEVDGVALQRRDRHTAILFVGKLPEDMQYVL